jgi:hypothetical protein
MQTSKAHSKLNGTDALLAAFHLQALQQMSVIAETEATSETRSYPSSLESISKPLETSRRTCDCSPAPGTVVRCIAPYGVAIRAGPEFSEKSTGFVRSGDTICIAEQHQSTSWIREMDGWIPLTDPRGTALFEVEAYA